MPIYVWIGYQQNLLQATADACANMNVTNAYGRVQETYLLTLTATAAPPVTNSVVVDGVPMTPPPSSSSGGSPDPPAVTLPSDDSVPYQEFSTDDSSLIWWLALGTVSWDPYNQVFLQIPPPIGGGVSATDAGREYVGNVSQTTYAPAGIYSIVDRNSPSPPVAGSDPNLGGVQASVAGSLTVDFLLNAERTALIGAPYDPNNTVTRPLTIVGNGDGNQSLVEFRDNLTGQPTWYICQDLSGVTTEGLNFGELNSQSKGNGRLFLQSGGNVGIGTTSPSQNLSVNAGINLDQPGANTGKLDPGLTFGNTDSEGISSNQSSSGSNQSGLDFYTLKLPRMSITKGGYVGIGTGSPDRPLAIQAQGTGQELVSFMDLTGKTKLHLNQNLSGTANGLNFSETNVADGRLFLQAGGNVGIGTWTPQQNLSVNGGINIDQANLNNGSPGNGIKTGPGLTFGGSSGEGIASCRGSGPNSYGLDFYTDFDVQVSVSQQGQVGVDQSNQNAGGSLTPGLVFGTGAGGRTSAGFGTGEGIASNRTTAGLNVSPGANQYGLDFYTQSQVRMQITNDGDVHIAGHLWVGGVKLA